MERARGVWVSLHSGGVGVEARSRLSDPPDGDPARSSPRPTATDRFARVCS